MLSAPGTWSVRNKYLLNESVFQFHNVSWEAGPWGASGERRLASRAWERRGPRSPL